MTELTQKILDDLFQLKNNLPQNPIAKLDETNTILHILATKKEIENATDDKFKNDCQLLLNELEAHYQELNRKNKPKLTYEEYKQSLKAYKANS